MKIIYQILRTLCYIFLGCIILFSWIFTKVDRTPYQEKEYYAEMRRNMQSVNWKATVTRGDTVEAGWSKVNITPPPDSVPLAGYGARWGASYNKVKDSVWVRTFVFDNGKEKVAYVTMDLLIVPPALINYLQQEYEKLPLPLDQVYFTATHSHASFGGWAPGMVGKLFAGAFNPKVIENLAHSIRQSLGKAIKNKTTAKIGFFQQKAGSLVTNRLIDDSDIIDPWVRTLKISKDNGKTAVLTTFSAHATCYGISFMQLSGDYPGQLVKNLEQDHQIDFAAFSAGAVGSHKPASKKPLQGSEALKNHIALTIAGMIRDTLSEVSTTPISKLGMEKVSLPLREPHIRISENWRLRPWFFYQLYGDYPSSLSTLRLEDITFLGAPCDFSGMLSPGVYNRYSTNSPVIITSFNGGYIGYVTPDKYYDLNEYETRVMNWFGPYNGSYLTEMMGNILKNLNRQNKKNDLAPKYPKTR